MTAPPTADQRAADAARFRRTLVKVMTVQVVTLLLLWWLQRYFSN
jgi:hypothetical protein